MFTDPAANRTVVSASLRNGGIRITNDSIQIATAVVDLPAAMKQEPRIREMLDFSEAIIVRGAPKNPRMRPDWPMLSYKYRLWLTHSGLTSEGKLPPAVEHAIKKKLEFWNRLCDLMNEAITAGQPLTSEEIDALAEACERMLTEFNNSVRIQKDKLRFPEDDKKEIPARRYRGYIRTFYSLAHRKAEGRPYPEKLCALLSEFRESHPHNFAPLWEFERNHAHIASNLASEMGLPILSTGRSWIGSRRFSRHGRATRKRGWMDFHGRSLSKTSIGIIPQR